MSDKDPDIRRTDNKTRGGGTDLKKKKIRRFNDGRIQSLQEKNNCIKMY